MKRETLLMGIVILAWPTCGLGQTFDVTLVKVEAIRLVEESDEYFIYLDGDHWPDPKRPVVEDEPGKKRKPVSKVKFWRFGGEQPLTRKLNVKCLKRQRIDSVFNIEAFEADGARGDNELGAFDATLVERDGNVQLRFEDNFGLHDVGRVVEKDKIYWWITLQQPSGSPPAEYKHYFEITVNMDE